jgi:hypothetical protein
MRKAVSLQLLQKTNTAEELGSAHQHEVQHHHKQESDKTDM